MANTFIIKNGQMTNIADAVLAYAEPAFAFNTDKSKVELYVGTGTNNGKGKLLVNPDVTAEIEAVLSKATTTADGLMSKEDKAKLDGIAENANNYTHPSSHSASMITEDSTHRFVTDEEKATWNAKLGPNSTIDGGTF